MSDPQTSIGPWPHGDSRIGQPLEAAVRVVLGIQAGQDVSEAELVARLLTMRVELERLRGEVQELDAEVGRLNWLDGPDRETGARRCHHCGAVENALRRHWAGCPVARADDSCGACYTGGQEDR